MSAVYESIGGAGAARESAARQPRRRPRHRAVHGWRQKACAWRQRAGGCVPLS